MGVCYKKEKSVVEDVGWPGGDSKEMVGSRRGSSHLPSSSALVKLFAWGGSLEAFWIDMSFSIFFYRSFQLPHEILKFSIQWLSISSQSLTSFHFSHDHRCQWKARDTKLYIFAMTELVPALSTDNAHYSSAHVFLMAHFTVLYIKLLWHLLFTANTVQVKIGFI